MLEVIIINTAIVQNLRMKRLYACPLLWLLPYIIQSSRNGSYFKRKLEIELLLGRILEENLSLSYY